MSYLISTWKISEKRLAEMKAETCRKTLTEKSLAEIADIEKQIANFLDSCRYRFDALLSGCIPSDFCPQSLEEGTQIFVSIVNQELARKYYCAIQEIAPLFYEDEDKYKKIISKYYQFEFNDLFSLDNENRILVREIVKSPFILFCSNCHSYYNSAKIQIDDQKLLICSFCGHHQSFGKIIKPYPNHQKETEFTILISHVTLNKTTFTNLIK